MEEFNFPDCIVQALVGKSLTNADYHLAGAGRAVAFIRMAAMALENLDNQQIVAEYHAYAGISATRTAIDATGSWLRLLLALDVKTLSQVDLKRQDYRQKILAKAPGIQPFVESLGKLAGVVDEHRQRAQHREGLALIHHLPAAELAHPGGWYLAPNGLRGKRQENIRIPDLLKDWAERAEQDICKIVNALALQASGGTLPS